MIRTKWFAITFHRNAMWFYIRIGRLGITLYDVTNNYDPLRWL